MSDDGGNTQQTRVNQQDRNGQKADVEPHRVHLLAAERELLDECHSHGVYLALCGAVLAVSELDSSLCEETCERMVGYCPACLLDAAKHNAEAGLTLDSRRAAESAGERRQAGCGGR